MLCFTFTSTAEVDPVQQENILWSLVVWFFCPHTNIIGNEEEIFASTGTQLHVTMKSSFNKEHKVVQAIFGAAAFRGKFGF